MNSTAATGTQATATKRRILVVDDEQGILNAMRRELSTPPLGRHRYEVETFTDPAAALERARVQDFEAVLSDFRMPGMSGLEFLKALAKIRPDCVRLVLSGQTDLDSLVRMINETHIFRFIPKPWSAHFLKSSLAQAIDFRQAAVENRRLAEALRAQGIALPAGAVDEVDAVLVVDEDPNVASAVARNLTQHSRLDDVFLRVLEEAHGDAARIDPARIRVATASSAHQALKLADGTEFSCVISDSRIPGMGGAQFLAAFAEKHPDCACIMLSGDANMDGIVTALDLAHIHALLAKPWTDFELRAAVAQALTRRRLAMENRILAQMSRSRNLGAIG